MNSLVPTGRNRYDRPYGKVQYLCEILGYGSRVRGDPRCFRKLNSKTSLHRKEFVKIGPHIERYPLDIASPVAQECAKSFLDKNVKLFSDFNMPEDHDKLVSSPSTTSILFDLT
jgi:hypothetical protein